MAAFPYKAWALAAAFLRCAVVRLEHASASCSVGITLATWRLPPYARARARLALPSHLTRERILLFARGAYNMFLRRSRRRARWRIAPPGGAACAKRRLLSLWLPAPGASAAHAGGRRRLACRPPRFTCLSGGGGAPARGLPGTLSRKTPGRGNCRHRRACHC